MLKILAIVGAVVVVAIGAILIYASTKPDSFRVERSTAMNAPPEKIFPYIEGLKRWTEWSPYEGRDPAMKRTYSGAESGKGMELIRQQAAQRTGAPHTVVDLGSRRHAGGQRVVPAFAVYRWCQGQWPGDSS